jgi:hypothetical protein
MASPLGFMILSHRQPAQVARLMWRLEEMFPGAPTVCHHDYSQSSLDREAVPRTVSFVDPHRLTAWADWSVVEATFDLVTALLARVEAPEWLVFLTGADYPVAPAERIASTFSGASVDAFIHHESIVPPHFRSPNQRIVYERYFYRSVHYPVITRSGRIERRTRQIWNRWLLRMLLPYSARRPCYWGLQSFAVNRRAARHLVEVHARGGALLNHYRGRPFSDESYPHTILANAPELRIANDNLRYMDWSANDWHPKVLTKDDVPAIIASGALFARKFDPTVDGGVLDRLDELITGRAAARS